MDGQDRQDEERLTTEFLTRRGLIKLDLIERLASWRRGFDKLTAGKEPELRSLPAKTDEKG